MISIENISNPKNIKAELYSIIKNEAEETFGRRLVTSKDCIQLSEEIYFKTAFRINSNTLRRFFGLVKAEYPPSVSTLNILTRYCGFNSLDEIAGAKKVPENYHQKENRNFLNYLITLFKSTQVKDTNDETFLALVKHTITFLCQNPKLADKFQRAIVKTKNGHEFYFEQFVHIDKINSFYGEGLRYYINEKKTPETQIFGYSLLCQRDWLINDHSALKKNFEHIKIQSLSRAMRSFVYGKYFAAHLFYADAFGLDTERILIEAYQVHSEIKPSKNSYKLFQSFEYTFPIALVLTKHFEEALYYINYAFVTYPETHSYMDQGCYKKMSLLKAIALTKTGEEEYAAKIFNQLRPSQFYFLSKKMDTILYLLLAGYLKKSNYKLEKQLMDLIEETGFIKLQLLKENDFAMQSSLSYSKQS